ncbi:NADH-quinone oxidoreductase subunit NuoK [Microbulbifer guangxiensis]|uniref:NADH-quinone oxidoreductase subunit NuoK n=1 Tax=Microbulbifer guangxiensis TaxID=2904249 RepID=UPI001F011EC6|nr:NADH-quinone oxidoreductase subunit NuoK [Microbulbifer guangxiensis]
MTDVTQASADIALQHGLLLASALFCLGLIGMLVRRNVLFMLMSVEICTNAAALAFVVAGAHWGNADGQVMFVFAITVAAAEIAIGLALALHFYRHHKTVDIDQLSGMRG